MFHVPELSRDTTHPVLATTSADGNNGAFLLESPEPGWQLALICSDGSDPTEKEKWEHVSVHAYRDGGNKQRCPTWKEMCYVKRLCWDSEDVVMQLHPRESEIRELPSVHVAPLAPNPRDNSGTAIVFRRTTLMFTTLKAGPTLPDAVLLLAVDLETRGFRLYRDREILRVTQGEKLTPEDRTAIGQYKLHLLELVDYVVKSA